MYAVIQGKVETQEHKIRNTEDNRNQDDSNLFYMGQGCFCLTCLRSSSEQKEKESGQYMTNSSLNITLTTYGEGLFHDANV